MISDQKDSQLIKGALLMSAGFFFVGLLGAFLKEASQYTSGPFAVWIAYLTSFVVYFFVVIRKGFGFLKTEHIFKHFFRASFGVTATMLYVFALNHIILMNATLLFNTTPLFVPLIAIIFLHHKISWKVWIALLIGFIGVVFIIKPTTAIFEQAWNLIGIASGLSLAIAFTYVKVLTATDPPERIIFYFLFIGTLLGMCILPFYWAPPSLIGWGYAILAGIAFVLAQVFIVRGYQVADASSVGPFQYVSVVVAGFLDWIIWKEKPEMMDYLGTVLVICGGVLVILLTKAPHTKKQR